uniref:Uncharacterized protein n=1 Tax=Gibberella zeae TaxID=5518 RepID=A0A4E9E7S5_GIBZA
MDTSQASLCEYGVRTFWEVIQGYHGFSAYCPYLITCYDYSEDPTVQDFRVASDHSKEADICEYDSKYLKTISPPWNMLSVEMQHLIRKELRLIFFENTAAEIRRLDEYNVVWRSFCDIDLPPVKLPPLVNIKPEKITHFLNKEVMLYIDADEIGYDGYKKVGTFMFREWLRLHEGRPAFQRESFVAAPMNLDQSFKSLQSFRNSTSISIIRYFHILMIMWTFIRKIRNPTPYRHLISSLYPAGEFSRFTTTVTRYVLFFVRYT